MGFQALVTYLYVGTVDGGEVAKFQPPTSDSCATVIQILQLADMWRLPHLKQWCEKYLGSITVVDLYNICDLLTTADMANALQLKKKCLFLIRNMLST